MAGSSKSLDQPSVDDLPERISDALKAARDLPEYQELRKFRFLHMFSGKEDVLSKCLSEMAKREGLQLEVYSLDKQGEGDVDLTKDHPFMELREEANASAMQCTRVFLATRSVVRDGTWSTEVLPPSGHFSTSMACRRTHRRSNNKRMWELCWLRGRWKSSGPC